MNKETIIKQNESARLILLFLLLHGDLPRPDVSLKASAKGCTDGTVQNNADLAS